MLTKGTKVRVKDHTRYQTLTTDGHASLVNPTPRNIRGGKEGVITQVFDNGCYPDTYEISASANSQYNLGEYTEDELEVL